MNVLRWIVYGYAAFKFIAIWCWVHDKGTNHKPRR